MISKLRRRYTILVTASILILMCVLVAIMNIINYSTVVRETDEILDVISQPNNVFFEKKDETNRDMRNNINNFIPRGMSPEVPYESRFFTVSVSADGTIAESDFSKILSVDDDTVKKYVDKAVNSNSERGFADNFRFSKTDSGLYTKIVFLDCGRKIDAFKAFLWTSLAVGMGGCLVVFVLFLFVSGRIVKPIAESYEKQKRFISDAGHEIKTPLTIIRANVDLLELDGEKEELTEIKNQSERLTKLTNDLVYLSKMDEKEHTIQKIVCPMSDIVSETANSFKAPVTAKNIGYYVKIASGITVKAAPDALEQLVSVLIENAVKYTPETGIISVDLSVQKKNAVLCVSNTTTVIPSEDSLKNLFDRFYRTDKSRNSETGGHGIGLSIAKAITDAHGGTIVANVNSPNVFCITVSLPI